MSDPTCPCSRKPGEHPQEQPHFCDQLARNVNGSIPACLQASGRSFLYSFEGRERRFWRFSERLSPTWKKYAWPYLRRTSWWGMTLTDLIFIVLIIAELERNATIKCCKQSEPYVLASSSRELWTIHDFIRLQAYASISSTLMFKNLRSIHLFAKHVDALNMFRYTVWIIRSNAEPRAHIRASYQLHGKGLLAGGTYIEYVSLTSKEEQEPVLIIHCLHYPISSATLRSAGGTRTHTWQILSLLSLPLDYCAVKPDHCGNCCHNGCDE